MTHVDTHKPCPICGKPFEEEPMRNFASSSSLHLHLMNKQDEAHRKYREQMPEPMVELHAIYCDCERCKEARLAAKMLEEKHEQAS